MFAAPGPSRIWNNLPASLWDKEVSCTEFRRQLKTYMLQTVCGASWPFWLLHLINTLTYLHVSQYTHAHTVSCTRVYRSSIIICVVHHTAHINIGYGQFVRIFTFLAKSTLDILRRIIIVIDGWCTVNVYVYNIHQSPSVRVRNPMALVGQLGSETHWHSWVS